MNLKRGKKCPACFEVTIQGAFQCPGCGTNLEKVEVRNYTKEAFEFKASPGPPDEPLEDSTPELAQSTPPVLAKVFYILSVLSLMGGIILCAASWPKNISYSLEKTIIPYGISTIWLIAGVIEAALFAGMGLGLTYLKLIAENTSRIVENTSRGTLSAPESSPFTHIKKNTSQGY